MKNNTRKILLALLLVFTLLASLATVTAFAEDTAESADGNITIYFENNWLWTEVSAYYWDANNTPNAEWPGVAMTNVGSMNGHELYSASIPADVAGLIISGIKDDGSGNRDQTPDIISGIVDGAGWRMLWVDGNQVESFVYDPNAPVDPNPTPGVTTGTYTVAGVSGLCGSEWDVNDTYNDMTLNVETGLYEKTFTGIPAGDYECKVAADHSWNQSWGSEGNGEFGNYSFTLFEEQNVTITFNPANGEIKHVLSASTGTDPNRPIPEVPDYDETDTITIYLGDSAYWNTVYYYCWTLGSSDQIATWPGLEMEWDSEKLLYYAEVPKYFVNIIFSDGNGTQTADLVIPGDGALFDNLTNEWGDIKNYTPPTPPENTSEDITVHVKDDAGWGEVYIYYWDADGMEAFVWPGTPMELGDDGYYTAVIPAGYWGIIFSNGGSWEDGSLQQTPDLIIPTNGKVYLSNGHEYLYNEGSADDNNAWYSLGGSNGGNQGDGTGDGPSNDDGSNDDQPAQEMTFIQKIAKAILLFLRSIQDFFKGIFKK